MIKQSSKPKESTPLLVGLSIERTGEDLLPGHYDTEQDVWVVESRDGWTPIVIMARDVAELYTKTEARPERDDVESIPILETATKTNAQIERDDFVKIPSMDLLQLFTKTKAHNERDDS